MLRKNYRPVYAESVFFVVACKQFFLLSDTSAHVLLSILSRYTYLLGWDVVTQSVRNCHF